MSKKSILTAEEKEDIRKAKEDIRKAIDEIAKIPIAVMVDFLLERGKSADTPEVIAQREFDKTIESSDNYTFDDGMTDEDLEEYVKKATSTERVEGLGMLFNEAVNEAEKDMITQDDLDAVFAPDNEEEKVTLLKQEELNTLLTPDGGQTRETVIKLFNKDDKPKSCYDCCWDRGVFEKPKDCKVEGIDLQKYGNSRHPNCHFDVCQKGEKK